MRPANRYYKIKFVFAQISTEKWVLGARKSKSEALKVSLICSFDFASKRVSQ